MGLKPVNMTYYQLKISCVLKQDLDFKNMFEELSKIINKSLLEDKKLKELHELNTFKMYVFDGLYPASKEGYKKFNLYGFNIKTVDRNLAFKLNSLLKKTENDLINIISVVLETKDTGKIEALYTVTPAISVIKSGSHWTKEDYPIELLIDRINSNAKKKYTYWFDEDIDEEHNFIESIEQANRKVIVLPYKDGVLLTNKFKIKVKGDEISQQLAGMVFTTGLLEKNALGLGYCTIAR